MKEVSTSTSWQSNTLLLHTGNVYFVSETENGKQDTCNLEELMAAETSNSSEGHRYEVGFFFFSNFLENIHFLASCISFPNEKHLTQVAFLVILGHVLSEPKQGGFRDGTPNTKSSVTGRWHPEMTAPALVFTPD